MKPSGVFFIAGELARSLRKRFPFLNDAYVETVLNKDVINAFPARTICPRAMHQHDILYEDALCPNGYTAERGKE